MSGDFVRALGERLSTPILCAVLEEMGLKVKFLTGWKAGIVTDDNFGEAKPLMALTRNQVKDRLLPLLNSGVIPVVAGYVASTQDGHITTLGRGGSDYTASLLGAALEVDEILIWTDVDGIMTADPKIEPSTRVIPILSYAETAEMAFFGAKLHPKTLEPAIEKGIPARIRNAFNQSHPGSLIIKEGKIDSDIVKAVVMDKGVSIVTVNGLRPFSVSEMFSKLFYALAKSKVDAVMISQSSSESNVSLVIQDKNLEKSLKAIDSEFAERGYECNVNVERGFCVVAVIGAGMRGTPGVAARVFQAVARENINVIMIAQGSSELNISLVVEESDGERVVKAIHNEFKLGVVEEHSGAKS